MRSVADARVARRVAHQVWCCAVCGSVASLAAMYVAASEGAWSVVAGIAAILCGCAGAAVGAAAFRSWRGGES